MMVNNYEYDDYGQLVAKCEYYYWETSYRPSSSGSVNNKRQPKLSKSSLLVC